MQSKHYVLLGSGLAVAIAVGIGLATMQSRSPEQGAEVTEQPAPTSSSPEASPAPLPPPVPPKIRVVPNSSSPSTPPAPATPVPDSPPAPAVVSREKCVLTMAVVADPNPPLNVRATPSTAGIVVTQLKNGTYVTVVDQKDGWLQITVPVEGWISQGQTERGCNQLTARIRFPAGADSAQISDRFVGTGSHRYLLTASKGQTLTLTSQDGGLPAVIAPDGKPLTPPLDNTPSWSGPLPLSGEYTLLLDSNYKGYDYAFSVKVK